MKQRVIASGWGQCSPLAADVPTLIEAIAAGRCATSAPWFDNDDDWQNLRLGNNPHTARAACADAAPWRQLQPVIDEALAMAGLPASALQGPRVRVFLAGNGMRPSTIVVEDALRKDNYTTMQYSNLVLESLPESNFQKEYLMRLNG